MSYRFRSKRNQLYYTHRYRRGPVKRVTGKWMEIHHPCPGLLDRVWQCRHRFPGARTDRVQGSLLGGQAWVTCREALNTFYLGSSLPVSVPQHLPCSLSRGQTWIFRKHTNMLTSLLYHDQCKGLKDFPLSEENKWVMVSIWNYQERLVDP